MALKSTVRGETSYTEGQKGRGLDRGRLSGVRWDWVGMEWGKGMAGEELWVAGWQGGGGERTLADMLPTCPRGSSGLVSVGGQQLCQTAPLALPQHTGPGLHAVVAAQQVVAEQHQMTQPSCCAVVAVHLAGMLTLRRTPYSGRGEGEDA